MQNRKDVLVVMPAYNESRVIGEVVGRVKACLPEADVLVVDDGSGDETAGIAGQSGARVVSLLFNMGYGAALQTGYKYAREKGYNYILQLDADGQHEPAFLKNILRELETGPADVVIGSRYLREESYRPSFARRQGMKLFADLTSVIIKQKISDPTSGFQGFRQPVLDFLVSDYFPVDYPDADFIIMLHKCGFRIKEVPVIMKAGSGKSMHSGVKPLYYIFKMMLSILVTLLRKYPQTGGGRWT
jgi:glycosyltransferase involved in cell wall biosynthesis